MKNLFKTATQKMCAVKNFICKAEKAVVAQQVFAYILDSDRNPFGIQADSQKRRKEEKRKKEKKEKRKKSSVAEKNLRAKRKLWNPFGILR